MSADPDDAPGRPAKSNSASVVPGVADARNSRIRKVERGRGSVNGVRIAKADLPDLLDLADK
jgi:hypothetical protein